LIFLKKIKKFEIKNSKKTRADFKIFGENIIQKFEVTHPTKFGEGETEKKKKQPVPYKGATLVCYPHLPKLILHPHPLSTRRHRWIWPFSAGALPGQFTD
jgi:hypothetical protein